MNRSLGWSIGYLILVAMISTEPFVSDMISLANGWERTIPQNGWSSYFLVIFLILFMMAVVNWYHFKMIDGQKKSTKIARHSKEKYVWGGVLGIGSVGLICVSQLYI